MLEEKPDVILIAYYFPPDSTIGAARPYRFYKYLKKAGRRCWIVTASQQPSNAPPDVLFVLDKTDELWSSPERKPLSAMAHVERFARRYLVPAGIGIAWSIAAAQQCRAIIARNPGRRFVVVSTFPPVGVHLAGLLLSFRRAAHWIADFRDPLINLDPYLRRYLLAHRFAVWLQRFTFRRASGLIANTEQLADLWRGGFSLYRPKIHVIWNGFDPDEQPAPREIPARPYRVLAHAGTLYVGRTPTLIMESLERLRETYPETRDSRLLLVGPVENSARLDQAFCDRAARDGWLDLRDGMAPKDEAQRLIEEADYLLLLQPQSTVQVPGKLFEYLSVGRPIVAVVPRHSAVEYILMKAGVPYVCLYPDDEAEVRDQKLLRALRFPSTPVRFSAWFETQFNAEYQARQLASLVDGVFGNSP
jgi:glycosyltransferase involved in cell wall biosynthesis